jgi:hypothetical protein
LPVLAAAVAVAAAAAVVVSAVGATVVAAAVVGAAVGAELVHPVKEASARAATATSAISLYRLLVVFFMSVSLLKCFAFNYI